jgi:hypothetical protein
MGGCIDRLDWVLCCLMGKKEMLFVGLPPYTYITNPLRQINIAHMLCQNMLSNQGIASQPVCKLHSAVSRPEFRSLSITLLAAKERWTKTATLTGKIPEPEKCHWPDGFGSWTILHRVCLHGPPPGLTHLRAASP